MRISPRFTVLAVLALAMCPAVLNADAAPVVAASPASVAVAGPTIVQNFYGGPYGYYYGYGRRFVRARGVVVRGGVAHGGGARRRRFARHARHLAVATRHYHVPHVYRSIAAHSSHVSHAAVGHAVVKGHK